MELVVLFFIFITIWPTVSEYIDKAFGGERKSCPQCAEMIKPEAVVCRFCGYHLAVPEPKPSSLEVNTPVVTNAMTADVATVKCLRAKLLVYRSIIMMLVLTILVLIVQHWQTHHDLVNLIRERATLPL